MDNRTLRRSSSSPGYTLDGDIPDAQYEKDFSAFIDEALVSSDLEDEHQEEPEVVIKGERGFPDEGRDVAAGAQTVTVHDEKEEGGEADDEEEDYDDWEADIPPPLEDKHDSDFEPEEIRAQRDRAQPRRQEFTAPRQSRTSRKPTRRSSERRRSISCGSASSAKRASGFIGGNERPIKKMRTAVNPEYLDLLNHEIRDAAQRNFLASENDRAGSQALRESQVGLTVWTVKEKESLFDIVARLGAGDLAGIASLLGSKSVVEVGQYLSLISDAVERRNKTYSRPLLQVAELPAAVELSAECLEALDEAADAVSTRQEQTEERREEKRWGPGCWRVDAALAKRLDQRDAENLQISRALDFAELFHVSTWLSLSGRIFMNSTDPVNNWTSIDHEPPRIWTTALKDFHSVAVSMTRRLVQTTLFIAMSRLRTKKAFEPRTKDLIRREDVAAALSTLNLESRKKRFWKGAARRLKFDVFDDRTDRGSLAEDEANISEGSSGLADQSAMDEPTVMSLDEAEAYLGSDDEHGEASQVDSSRPENLGTIDDSEMEDSDSEDSETPVDDPDEPDTRQNHILLKNLLRTDPTIKQESRELFDYSAANIAHTWSNKLAVARRIVTERQQQFYADECDKHNARAAEREIWKMLDKPDPRADEELIQPKPITRTHLSVQRLLAPGMHWRKGLKYYNEWETVPDADSHIGSDIEAGEAGVIDRELRENED